MGGTSETEKERTRDGIVVLGKARGRKAESLQLLARTAVAAALWHEAREPRPAVLVVTRDAPEAMPDAYRVARRLEELGVPRERILARAWSNCTMIEARAVRVLARAHGLGRLTVLTHPYHRPRAEQIFREVVSEVDFLEVEPSLFDACSVPPDLAFVPAEVKRSMPRGVDLLRERLIEAVLSVLHVVDPRGRIERGLAAWVRPQV